MNLIETLYPTSPHRTSNAKLIRGRCGLAGDNGELVGGQIEYLAERLRLRKARRENIKQLLKTGRFSDKQVSHQLNIHLETIKKDLREMRKAGEIQAQHSAEKSGNQKPWLEYWA